MQQRMVDVGLIINLFKVIQENLGIDVIFLQQVKLTWYLNYKKRIDHEIRRNRYSVVY